MAEVDGPRRQAPTEETTIKVWAANARSGRWFYLEPGEELEIRDDDPCVIRVEVADGEAD